MTFKYLTTALMTISVLVLTSCVSQEMISSDAQPDERPVLTEHTLQLTESGDRPMDLPADGVQPWEELDGNGHVVPDGNRRSSAINGNSDFTPGVERFLDAGDVTENGEGLRLNGTDDTGSSYAMYRISLQAEQPGVISIDAIPLGFGSQYYVGISSYASGRWQWMGPFEDGRIRLPVNNDGSTDYTSALGNTFVTVMTDAGSRIDLVGVAVNQFDAVDTQAPNSPTGLTLNPVRGGLELNWTAVPVSDLAGYRIYYSERNFINPHSAGVRSVPYLEGSTRFLLEGPAERTWVALTAVDLNGNESPPTPVMDAVPLEGPALLMGMGTNALSGKLNTLFQFSAGGADFVDWDLDGDGIYEITDDTTGVQETTMPASGIIRPAMRGRDASGEAVAHGAISLIITGNTRPVASATADPQSGETPLSVSFTGQGEDSEDETAALDFAWDFDGDGIYDDNTGNLIPVRDYLSPGIFNAKFRVTDSEGAWDVDSLAIMATGEDRSQPLADFSWIGAELYRNQTLTLDASASSPSFGETITQYEWDLDGDGTFETDNGADPLLQHVFDNAGEMTVGLRVTETGSQQATLEQTLTVLGWRNIVLESGGQTSHWYQHMEIVNGKLAFAYGEWIPASINSLKYAFCNGDHAQVEDWEFITLATDETDIIGVDLDLEVIAGNPAISYINNGNSDLRYIRSTTADGNDPADWSSSISIQSDIDKPFSNNGLTEIDGRPALIYKDGDDLYYSHSSTTEGTSASDWVDLKVATDNYNFAMLNVIDGHPAIVYTRDKGNPDDLTFMRSSTPTGSSLSDWNDKETIDTGGIMGSHVQLETINGRPAIAYVAGNDDVRYAWSSFADGSDEWFMNEIVPGPGFPNDLRSLVLYRGRPAFLYRDNNNDKMVFLHSDDPFGNDKSSWTNARTFDSDENGPSFASMVIFEGRPVIVYHTLQDGDRYMKLAILYE